MNHLELLAPARNADIGIAAIDCGADAVYIAGPAFGARKAAGNSVEEISRLCEYAHKFGVRIFVAFNTIIFEEELEQAHAMLLSLQEAGADAFIIQDLAITEWKDITVPLHASTQCAIRTPQKAGFLQSLGMGRLVLERELSLQDIRAIREATSCELEAFVHGALCVCYSGQCYMSESIERRSANRGDCIQACRSQYDLEDSHGHVLLKDKALLSLKDLNLISRLGDLADAGVCSFKIEGRLKGISYVRNTVRAYSEALDNLVAAHPDLYARSSAGSVRGGFTPSLAKTFNRGYTSLYFDGRRDGEWSSMNATKSTGERIGRIRSIRSDRKGTIVTVSLNDGVRLANGDGFCIVTPKGITGFRGDVCEGSTIRCSRKVEGLREGDVLWRNISAEFEKEVESSQCHREIPVELDIAIHGHHALDITAVTADGRTLTCPFSCDVDIAENRPRQEALIRDQLSKRSGEYAFHVHSINTDRQDGPLPLLGSATLNSIRRCIASDLSCIPCQVPALYGGSRDRSVLCSSQMPFQANAANSQAVAVLQSRGAVAVEPAYELSHKEGAELMRTKYCIRAELGICPSGKGGQCKLQHKPEPGEKLLISNNGRRYELHFDCSCCEMALIEVRK